MYITSIPDTVHSDGWTRVHVALVAAILQSHYALAYLIDNQRSARETSLLARMTIQREAMLLILDVESGHGRMMGYLLNKNISVTRSLQVAPLHLELLAQHRVVGLLLPLALGHTARIGRIQGGDEPLYKGNHALYLVIRFGDICKEVRLLCPILTMHKLACCVYSLLAKAIFTTHTHYPPRLPSA